ncbi:hypothetical protein Pint_13386 [Pistacia integerrima]|uniref:Uncharacterized protein n=1 Tax=Pistacia integerrima TaxID=434235 RepID=A0ACC0Y9L1_9ROSI|nr:hypothetical protein Pint_13386 [Pistacia integerrima]
MEKKISSLADLSSLVILLFQNCIGKQSCSVSVVPDVFGGDPCPNANKKLSVEAICS